MRKQYRWFLLSAAAVAGLSLVACGSSSSSPTGPYGTPTPGTTPTPVTTPTPGTTPTPPPQSSQVAISNFAFSPASTTVSAGASVTWMNMDSVTHTSTADPTSAFIWDTGNISAGATSGPVVFNVRGTFTYHCNIHPFMHGTIVVQ